MLLFLHYLMKEPLYVQEISSSIMFIFRSMASIFQCHNFRISWFPVYNISKIIWKPSYCYVYEIYPNQRFFLV